MLNDQQIEGICKSQLGNCKVSSEYTDNGIRVVRITIGQKYNIAYNPTSEYPALRNAPQTINDERIVYLKGGEDESYLISVLQKIRSTLPENRSINNKKFEVTTIGGQQDTPSPSTSNFKEPVTIVTEKNPAPRFAGISNEAIRVSNPIIPVTPDDIEKLIDPSLQKFDNNASDKLNTTLDKLVDVVVKMNDKLNDLTDKKKK